MKDKFYEDERYDRWHMGEDAKRNAYINAAHKTLHRMMFDKDISKELTKMVDDTLQRMCESFLDTKVNVATDDSETVYVYMNQLAGYVYHHYFDGYKIPRKKIFFNERVLLG